MDGKAGRRWPGSNQLLGKAFRTRFNSRTQHGVRCACAWQAFHTAIVTIFIFAPEVARGNGDV
jgi:hypothetical protein